MTRALLLLALLTLNGCAYYNGMYNANRLSRRAEKAERDGRTFDASSFWAQAIVKADSVLARHPDSKWADDARLVRGKALARLNRCDAAVPELTRLQHELTEPDLVEEAGLELGRCRLAQRDFAGAELALRPLEASADAERREQARTLLGRARVAAGDYEGALELLPVRSDSTITGERLVALAGAGRIADARVLADSLIAAGSSVVPWGAFLRELGHTEPPLASEYLDRVRPLERDPARVAAWLVEDGRRLLPGDHEAGLVRLEEAERLAPGTEPGMAARDQRVRFVLADLDSIASLGPTVDSLRATAPAQGLGMTPGEGLVATAEIVRQAADSAASRPPNGDLMLFVAAELARDSLRAPGLAADLMRRLANEWPSSPYAPKALLALMALDQSRAEAARSDLESLYGASPYVTAAYGHADSTYQVLEDSLGTFAARWMASHRAPAPGRASPRGQPRPGSRTTEPDRPRPGARPGTRVAEPL